MFQHQHRLTHLLQPHHYYDAAHHQREIEELIIPSWQFLCTLSELRNPGDFVTLEIAGVPVLVRNFGEGNIRAFVNVCPHRHSRLTEAPHGNCDTLKCQYHGWEYNAEGRTGKIPEARAFRPWDRENSHLKPLRTESVGDVLFVALSDEAPSLKEWIGPIWDEIVDAYQTPQWNMREVWEFDVPCNWKVPTENTLESYHVAEVHPEWFGGGNPTEEDSEHVLEENYSTLKYKTFDSLYVKQQWACRYLGREPLRHYRHYHVHPNVTFTMTDTFNYVATTQPTSPTTARLRTRMYALHGTRRGPAAAFVRNVAWRIARKTMKQIFNEDCTIFPAQQRGLQSSDRPGVIGAREERIYQLQKFIVNRMNLDVPPDEFAGGDKAVELGGSSSPEQDAPELAKPR